MSQKEGKITVLKGEQEPREPPFAGLGWDKGGVIVILEPAPSGATQSTPRVKMNLKPKKADTYRQMLRSLSSLQFIILASKATSLSELRKTEHNYTV